MVEVVGIEPTCTSATDLQSAVPPLEHHLRNEFVSSSTLTIGTIRVFESRAPDYQGYVVIVDTWIPTISLLSSSSFRGLIFSTSTLTKLGSALEDRTLLASD